MIFLKWCNNKVPVKILYEVSYYLYYIMQSKNWLFVWLVYITCFLNYFYKNWIYKDFFMCLSFKSCFYSRAQNSSLYNILFKIAKYMILHYKKYEKNTKKQKKNIYTNLVVMLFGKRIAWICHKHIQMNISQKNKLYRRLLHSFIFLTYTPPTWL